MDFALSEEQQMLKETTRRFIDKECPRTRVRELLETSEGYSPELWRRIVELGWQGLVVPERYGGSGCSFLDLTVILEEIGRGLFPSPYACTVLLGAYPILEAGSEGQKSEFLPRIAKGELILTLAYQETNRSYNPSDIQLLARQDAEGFTLDGVKLFVPFAHAADVILTAVRIDDCIAILLVDSHQSGVRCTLLECIDDQKLCEVSFEGVHVSRANILGSVSIGEAILTRTLSRASVGECLQLIGGAQVALELSVEHVKNRVQFDHPIGAFQAVQHHCANMATDLDSARFLTYQAAWAISEGLPCQREVAMAKAWVSEASHRILSRAQQVHGGTGFIAEHDIGLYFKRTASGGVAYGGSTFHYRNLAAALEF